MVIVVIPYLEDRFSRIFVGITIRSAAEAGATITCEPRRYSLLFHYEKIVYMSMKQKTVQ